MIKQATAMTDPQNQVKQLTEQARRVCDD